MIRKLLPFLLPILLLAGCTRTIYVPHGTAVRLRETVKDVKVWVKDADGEPVAASAALITGVTASMHFESASMEEAVSAMMRARL